MKPLQSQRAAQSLPVYSLLVWAGLLALCLAPAVAAQSLAVPTMERAVELALEGNPALQAEQERRVETLGGVVEARAEAFPQIILRTGWNASRNPSLLNSADFEDLLDQFPGGSFEPQRQELYSWGVDVTQPIYTWGKVSAALDLARTATEVTAAQVSTERLDLALRAAEVYYRLLSRRSALATVEIQERLRQQVLAAVEARYELGDATRLDLLRARSGVAELGPLVARIRGDVKVAESELRAVLGVGSEVELRIGAGEVETRRTGAGEVIPGGESAAPPPSPEIELEAEPEAPGLGALLALARRQRPELEDLQLQDDALGHQAAVVRAEGKPQIELNGSYGRTARLAQNLDDALYRDWSLALGLRWELFDGGRRKGEVAQLESRQRQLRWRQEDLENRIRVEIEQALAAYQADRERLLAARAAAMAASEASRVAEEGYRQGVTLQTEWLEAQRDATEAELERVQATYDVRIRWAQLQRAVGLVPSRDWAPSGSEHGEGES
ncbi:MAG: TolC family protein [Acidobacteriota bacterium]|nr:TolC family protein [Acidobacteriota bacterium]